MPPPPPSCSIAPAARHWRPHDRPQVLHRQDRRRKEVAQRAGTQILDMLDQFEREHQKRLGDGAAARQAALDVADLAKAEAARKADLARGSAIAQANVLRSFKVYDDVLGNLRQEGHAPITLRAETSSSLLPAVRSLLTRDPWEISHWQNVQYLARDIRGRAHASFAEALDYLRPKLLGLKSETTRELDVLRALYGRTDVDPAARAAATAWDKTAEDLRLQFVAAGGALPARKNWHLPNPEIDPAKVRALGPEGFKALVRQHVDRAAMLDFDTGKPLSDARFELLLDQTTDGFLRGFVDGAPSAAPRGKPALASSRGVNRFFVWKDAEAWSAIAEAVGAHASPYETMLGHIDSIAKDVAMMRVLGA